MNFILSYAIKRFWRKRGQILTTSLFLCLGFWGWLLSESTQSSIKQRLENNARQILTADLAISVRREFSKEELDLIQGDVDGKGVISTGYDFFAMLNTSDESRLVQVSVIDDHYPFYGVLRLENNSTTAQLKNSQIWAYNEFKDLMNLKLGQKAALGEAHFVVSDFVLEDQSQTFRLASLAPSIFIHLDDLKKTNLIQYGSTFTSIKSIKIDSDVDVEALSDKLKKDLKDPGIDIISYKTLPDNISGPTKRLSDFLGLTSLVSLLFCSLSLFYLLQIWSAEQQKEKAALAIFGLSLHSIQGIEFVQSVLTACFSTALSTILVILSKPLVETSIREWFAADFSFRVTAREASIILFCQIILLAVLTFPYRKTGHSLNQLLKDQMLANQKGVHHFLPLLALIWPFAIFASRSWKNGTYFFLAILGICAALIFIGWLLLKVLKNIHWKNWSITYATRALSRQSTASWAFIVTVGVCSALLNLMPQIRNSIEDMMTLDHRQDLPSLFMFDIQKEQFADLKDLLKSHNIEIQVASPVIRARITKVNGFAFKREEKKGTFITREDETEANYKNRSVNLTYRNQLQAEEKIIKGDAFSFQYNTGQKHPFLSIEKGYAEKLKLNIGDVITFEIQGVEIEGEVRNFREVRWSRFEPNFYIIFQDGVLNDAPQTFLASIPHLDQKPKSDLMKYVSRQFANVSIIDVENFITKIVKNLDKVSGALKLMTVLSFMTGILALIFLISSESLRRAMEVHLLKVLGSPLLSVIQTRLNEILILSLISLIVGLSASYLISYFIVSQVFQISYAPQFSTAAILACLILGIALIVGKIMTAAQFRQNSFVFLKKEE
jgi:putative ABC transport system permease protein